MRARVRAAIAAVLSCSVYAIPLVGPHTFVLLGQWLFRNATRGQHSAPWLAAEVAGALAMQAIAGGLWYWILGHPRSLRLLVLAGAVPAWVAFAQWYYLLALPTRFLIERDVGAEQRAWATACTIPDRSLIVVGYKPAVVREPDAILASDSTARLTRVTITRAGDGTPTCSLAPLPVASTTPQAPADEAPAWVGDDGRLLISSTAKQDGAQSWLWVGGPGAPPVTLTPPKGYRPRDGAPVVSHDGRAIGWLTPAPGSGQPPALSVVIRSLPPAVARDDIVVDLSALGRASFVLRDVDLDARELLLAMNERTFVTIGFDGAVHGAAVRPDGVDPLHMTFRRVGDGWVAWDGYKDDGYTLVWALAGGRGMHRVPRGRGITDVAVHPDGRLIALSVTTSLSIGTVRDAVYVLRVADGAEAFRRYLVRYARSPVLFPARDLFAYSEYDGARATSLVLRIPPDALR
jgi:hypothetical protein